MVKSTIYFLILITLTILPIHGLFSQSVINSKQDYTDWSLFKEGQECFAATQSIGGSNLPNRLTLYRMKVNDTIEFSFYSKDIVPARKYSLSVGGKKFTFVSHPTNQNSKSAWSYKIDEDQMDIALAKGVEAIITGKTKKNKNFEAKFSLRGYTKSANWMQSNCGAKPIGREFAKVGKKETKKEEPKNVQRKENSSSYNSKQVYKVSSGSGFFISKQGHVLTNYHVIKGCRNIKEHQDGTIYSTTTVATDRVNDIALLKVNRVPKTILRLSEEKTYPLQDVIVAGFPFGKAVSSSIKFTKGIISSLSGVGDNYSQLQIDAALQPGNSGGPILDMKGNVVGIAVSKLDFKAVLKDFGVVPENTNFGIKSSAVLNFVSAKSIPIEEARTNEISKSELSKRITEGTTYLSCWMTKDQIKKLKTKKVMFEEFE